MKRLAVLLVALAVTLVTPMTVTSTTIELDDSRLASIMQVFLEQTSRRPSPAQRRAVNKAWVLLCFELRDVDCTGIIMPELRVFNPNPMRPGLMGYFKGGNLIYVRDNLYGGRREEVLAHEMSHYIDDQLGLLPPMPVYKSDTVGIIGLCKSEAIAWGVSDAYNRTNLWGNPKFIVGEDWVNWYDHCTPHKDVLYPRT
jgi:hypothetical protein